MKAQSESYKRFLLGGILPFAFLLILLPIAPRFVPGSLRNTHMVADSGQVRAGFPAARKLLQNSGVQTEYRRVALSVIARWESEYRRKGGRANISPVDLQRIRRALL